MWTNWVLAPLNLTDSDNGKVRYYRLFLDGGYGVGDFFGWFTSEILYLFIIVPSAYSSQLLAFVVDPAKWLKPIETAWTSVTSSILAFVSPTVLLAGVMLGAMLMVMYRARNSDEAIQAIVQRIASSCAMYLVILALLYNPAGNLLGLLTIWAKLLGGNVDDAQAANGNGTPGGTTDPTQHAGGATQDIANSTDSSVLTDFLRPLTWMLNYGSQLSPECGKAWATMIEKGGTLTCLDSSQVEASQSVGIAFVMTLVALWPTWIYCRFALVVILTFTTHLALAISRFAAAGAMAALAPWQERPFDEFLRFMVSAVANLAVASGIVAIAKLGPGAAVSVAAAFTDAALAHFAVLVLAYYLLSTFVWGMEKQFGPIRDWLMSQAVSAGARSDDESRWWNLAFPGGLKPQGTAVDRMISGVRQSGSQWATQARERLKEMADTMQGRVAAVTDSSGRTTMNGVEIAPETPQSAALLSPVDTTRGGLGQAAIPEAVRPKVQAILARFLPRSQPASLERMSPAGGATAMDSGRHAVSLRHEDTPDHAVLNTGQSSSQPALPHATALPSNGSHATAIDSWHQRLRRDSQGLATATAPPEMIQPIRLDSALPATASTFTDPRGNALMPMDPRAPLSSYLARAMYMEIVLRAMGWTGKIQANDVLPPDARFFRSGLDESGNWITEFHS
ncbi:hypothetical protein [Mycobacteroides abscessus]|uniref:hypothetical protein n=1 Tax=Mycobacteroides abscessus TaxID=36809 RepID=UPI001E3CDCFA